MHLEILGRNYRLSSSSAGICCFYTIGFLDKERHNLEITVLINAIYSQTLTLRLAGDGLHVSKLSLIHRLYLLDERWASRCASETLYNYGIALRSYSDTLPLCY